MASSNSDTLPDKQGDALAQGFPPISAPDARILVLGSMPGRQSLRAQAYYAHPRNAFWPIMGTVLGFDSSLPYVERTAALLRHRIALWDVLDRCIRPGSLDADIDRASMICNDFGSFLLAHPAVERIVCNGTAAHQLFLRQALPTLADAHAPVVLRLPSTSPAHAGMRFADKLAAWRTALSLDE